MSRASSICILLLSDVHQGEQTGSHCPVDRWMSFRWDACAHEKVFKDSLGQIEQSQPP